VKEKVSRLRIHVEALKKDKDKSEGIYERIKNLKRALPRIQVKGLPQADRAVISKDEKKQGNHQLLIEGYGLAEVMGTDGESPPPGPD